MKKIYRFIMILLIVAVAGGISCSQASPAPSSTPAPSASPAPASSPSQSWELKMTTFGTRNGEDSSWAISNKFADIVKERTEGQVVFEVYGNNEIVGMLEFLTACEEGVIDAFDGPDGVMTGHLPGIAWATVGLRPDWPGPYLEYWETSGIKELVESKMAERNLMPLTCYNWGDTQCFITSKRHVKSVDDFKGLKLRTPPGEAIIPMLEELGASPTPMPGGEVYTSMERGVIDGAYTGVDGGVRGWKLYEIADYLTFTGKFPWGGGRFIVISKSVFDSMPADTQQILLDAARDTIKDFAVDFIEDNKNTMLARFEEFTGSAPYVVPDDELARWEEIAAPAAMKFYLAQGGMADEAKKIYEAYGK